MAFLYYNEKDGFDFDEYEREIFAIKLKIE